MSETSSLGILERLLNVGQNKRAVQNHTLLRLRAYCHPVESDNQENEPRMMRIRCSIHLQSISALFTSLSSADCASAGYIEKNYRRISMTLELAASAGFRIW